MEGRLGFACPRGQQHTHAHAQTPLSSRPLATRPLHYRNGESLRKSQKFSRRFSEQRKVQRAIRLNQYICISPDSMLRNRDERPTSTLERAVLAGETKAYLTANNRAHGNSLLVPNQLAYNSSMISGLEVLWPKELDDIICHLKTTIDPALPDKQTNFLVEFPHAYVTTIGQSRVNITHRNCPGP